MRLRCKKIFSQMVFILLISIVMGCIPELTDETPLAMVNNEPVTYGEFKDALQGIHLRMEDRGETGPMELKNFLDKLIRKRLFIQEAIRVGLDQDPAIDHAVESELKKQAVLLLHREEISDQVEVSDDEVWEGYCALLNKRRDDIVKIHEGYSMDPNGRSQAVNDYIVGLRKRSRIEIDPNFRWHGAESCDPNKIIAKYNDKGITYRDLASKMNALKDEFGEEKAREYALQGMIDQGLLEQTLKMYVPARDSFKKVKNRMKKDLKKERLKEREEAYLEELRQKARITRIAIDPNKISRMDEDPNHPFAWVNDVPITLSELRSDINVEALRNLPSEERKNMIDDRLKYLIDCRLVDQEALSKGYEKRPDIQKFLIAVRERIIYNKFFQELLIPSIKLKDEEVEMYYHDHPELFRTPIYVKVDEIRVKTKEEADQIWSELEAGADFAFLSRQSISNRITSQHWMPIHRFSPSIQEKLAQSSEGDRFGPVLWKDSYSIFLLKRRQGGERVPFDKARKDVHEKLWKERYETAIQRWEGLLKASSEIVIYEDRLQAILSKAEFRRDKETVQ